MGTSRERPPVLLGPILAVLGLVGLMVAGSIWPVYDDRPLKMSCYWAMRAVVPLSAGVALCGVVCSLASTREAAAALAIVAAGIAALQVLTIHRIIPVMPHNTPHQRAHDLLALLVILVALAGLLVMRPGTDIDEALNAAAAPHEQPPA